jgi:hypothetical protein
MQRADDVTWRCDACGDTRPDALIRVHTRYQRIGRGFTKAAVSYNLKYCDDRPACYRAVQQLGEMWSAGVAISDADPVVKRTRADARLAALSATAQHRRSVRPGRQGRLGTRRAWTWLRRVLDL